MKWFIPAKTFLIGEYVALHGGPALVLTTAPCFEVILTEIPGLHGLHQQSPAGRWWLNQSIKTHGLAWYDPYQGLGGLGASSAQFLGAYMASQYVMRSSTISPKIPELMDAFLQSASQGIGLKPSGYDVLAQHLEGCAFIHHQQRQYVNLAWPFKDLDFILLRTGVKIPTHEHLNQLDLQDNLNPLIETAALGCQAFQMGDSQPLIDAICIYHEQLKKRGWVSPHSLKCIDLLHAWLKPVAIKGCGALGADVLLMLVQADNLGRHTQELALAGWNVLATSQDLWGAKVTQSFSP